MSGRNEMIRVSSLLIALVAGAATGLAWGQADHPQGGGQAGQAVRLDVTQNGHARAFMVDRADAAKSPATLVYGTTGMQATGYTLYNRVVVKSNDVNLVRRFATAPGQALAVRAPRIEASADVPGWVVVEADTVRQAVEIARSLRESGRFASISVETDEPRANRDLPGDPLVGDQWYLENTSGNPGDLNVSAVYDMGITGQGVVVGILEAFDDNFQTDHPDLAANWVPSLSMDTTPFWTDGSQSHPTAVAGLVAGVANNGVGIAGVAHGAKMARLRNGTMLVRGRAMQWFYNSIQVKTNSWGPANPPFLFPAHTEEDFVMDALERGARFGRGGRGEIFLFASGNDGPTDRVDYEPLGSSRYTLAIGAVDENMDVASYSQGGTSLFATCYSGPGMPSPFIRRITTTTSGSDYISSFSGTSAAAPIAAGVIALMLEANPNLTYRDVQHIIADTAIPSNFENQTDYFYVSGATLAGETWWQVNGAFTRHSDEYGFGVIDAEAAVNAALSWSGSPSQQMLDTYDIPGGAVPGAEFIEIPAGGGAYFINTAVDPSLNLTLPFCVKSDIRLEVIEVEITSTGGWAGDWEVMLVSPWGSASPLAIPRPDPGDYTNYVLTTFKHWDEPSAGEWTLRITDFIPDAPFDVEGASVDLSPYGLDGIDGAGEKELPQFRIRMYGTALTEPNPYLCDINNQSCPGDLNGDGIVSPEDLIFFLDLYDAGDPFADINGDGVINYDDLLQFFNSFRPGFCPSPDNDGPSGRPMPGGSDNGTPIGPGGGAG